MRLQLIKAAADGDLASVTHLLAAEADPDGRDPEHGNSPLGEAAAYGHAAVVEALLVVGARVDGLAYSDATPLMLTAYHGQTAMARRLLAAGAAVRFAKAATGETALHWAALRDRTDIAQLLLDAGAEVNARTFAKGGAGDFPWLEVCGETPLHYAAAYSGRDLVQLLLAAGADLRARTVGETPLQWAKLLRRPAGCRDLLAAECSPAVGAAARKAF